MLKWKALAMMGLAVGVAGVGWGYAAQQQHVPGFYKLRIRLRAHDRGDQLAGGFEEMTPGTGHERASASTRLIRRAGTRSKCRILPVTRSSPWCSAVAAI